MSDHERIAQVVHQKWANEQIANFFRESLICSFMGKKWAIRSETDERIPSPDLSYTFCFRPKQRNNDRFDILSIIEKMYSLLIDIVKAY